MVDLNRLPPTCRRCVILVRFEGMTPDEAAAQLGLSDAQVRLFLVRAQQFIDKADMRKSA